MHSFSPGLSQATLAQHRLRYYRRACSRARARTNHRCAPTASFAVKGRLGSGSRRCARTAITASHSFAHITHLTAPPPLTHLIIACWRGEALLPRGALSYHLRATTFFHAFAARAVFLTTKRRTAAATRLQARAPRTAFIRSYSGTPRMPASAFSLRRRLRPSPPRVPPGAWFSYRYANTRTLACAGRARVAEHALYCLLRTPLTTHGLHQAHGLTLLTRRGRVAHAACKHHHRLSNTPLPPLPYSCPLPSAIHHRATKLFSCFTFSIVRRDCPLPRTAHRAHRASLLTPPATLADTHRPRICGHTAAATAQHCSRYAPLAHLPGPYAPRPTLHRHTAHLLPGILPACTPYAHCALPTFSCLAWTHFAAGHL